MSDQNIHLNKYAELRSAYKYYIDLYNALYQLKTEKEEDLISIYKKIKTELIDSKKYPPQNIISDILHIIPYNNRYTKSYLTLAKLISDEYQVKQVKSAELISIFLFYKEYGIKLNKSAQFEKIDFKNLDIHSENTIYRAIMDNDIEKFIFFTESEGFDKNQTIKSDLYPFSNTGYSLLNLCSYHGAVDCFKLLRTKFNSEINQISLELSFLGRNPEIMSECLKYKKPDERCMKYAIISHNIDFVTFLMNEYHIDIDMSFCKTHKNLESFLVYFDQTNNVNRCFIGSIRFRIPSLCEYFLSHGANVNEKNRHKNTVLHKAAYYNSIEIVKLFLSYGANINEKGSFGKTALHRVTWNNSKETAEFLISHGANINEKDESENTVLHCAAWNDSKEIVELLISHGANINEKNKNGNTALHYAAEKNGEEIVELLISLGAYINEKDDYGQTALHIVARENSKATAEFLISHGINIHEKDNDGKTALHLAALNNSKETAELLISHGININEKDKNGKTALHIAADFNMAKMAELLILHDTNIYTKDKHGKTALEIATEKGNYETCRVLKSHSAQI
ncbi:ankyrin repeat protein, putative [Trichomonas vaginalis G3]|uniref:Ankyrin repeat protein, putative n=1 Tax=Trichomonas vaginalis (strain ATCC PRA-98 / G3) TaxID=412133 RepID=A2EXI8_TRIV3|nr:ankyrin repeat and SOCS box-containing protein 4 family [Trichomonas vaginalis G3]EAY02605.1 ankyrin repeat protein, putative [Trichomonas vaginalis G3]KAI5553368.1 ankyrin repeat and SOCS box-containing protein 4 family [Trichomonas vaginalis G3]|eukprot:XP_001314828.1 ankyrin repeat protein [Trichomonas vaginalis G3]